METQAKGNWQSGGTLLVATKGPNDMFSLKQASDVLTNTVTNTISMNTIVELKQPLSITTEDQEGNPLPDAQSYIAGQCKITKIPKNFGTLQDCFVDDTDKMVYRFLVTAPKTTDGDMLYGVQISATKGTGARMMGGGMGLNTFLFQIK